MKFSSSNEPILGGEVVKGRWILGPGHELQYKEEDGTKQAVLSATLISIEPHRLVASVTVKESPRKTTTSLAKLTGEWKTNGDNQFVFEVERKSGKTDTLTFTGSWEVNPDHEIVYSYEEEKLKRSTKKIHSLVIKGYWELTEKSRLAYWIGGDSESALRFRGAFESASMRAKKGELRYRLGAEIQRKRKTDTLVLFGEWKVSDKLDLSFEMEYSNGEKKSISFGAEYRLNKELKVEVQLKARDGEPLGVELVLTKDIFDDQGEMFVRLKKSLEESAIEAGVSFKW